MALPLFLSQGRCLVFSNGTYLNVYKSGIRGLKSELNIKWVRPQKVSCLKPEKSGDLKPLGEVDKTQYPIVFQNSEELKTANDVVKRLFTLEYWPQRESMILLKNNYVDSVKRHKLDRTSSEARIAGLTLAIRKLQQHIEKHPYDRVTKVICKELIEKRRKRLKLLRGCDYKRFEWLLEKLDIIFKPPPVFCERVERKKSLRRLTDLHCEELRKQELDEYKAKLNAQKEDFLKKKAETLQWIIKEEEECGVTPTVTQEQIDSVLSQLKELQLSNNSPKSQ